MFPRYYEISLSIKKIHEYNCFYGKVITNEYMNNKIHAPLF